MTPQRVAAGAFVVSALSSIALTIVYFVGESPQLQGILLGLSLGGLGLGIVIAATKLLDVDEEIEEREPLASSAKDQKEALDIAEDDEVTRRKMLRNLGGAASTALTVALAIPALSLGPNPGQSLFKTAWVRGKRLVDVDGNPLRADAISSGTVETVFPQGLVGAPDAQAVIVRVDPASLVLPEGRESWAPDGVVAYSKICTHAGCPVGLYRAESHELLCPCHQSTFDVLNGAQPNFGPADRPLPQLPLEVDDQGYLVAGGDFSDPVGPGFWNMTHG